MANPAAAEDFLATINRNRWLSSKALSSQAWQLPQPEKAYQFEREGYFCADSRYSTAERLVFNRTVGLRDTWAKIGA
ncbi:Glutamine--tRNA ligase [Serratia fonticola]|uniref:50S ribosomal protein L25 n=1 Tax=Serratia fonticola TaxID=47917 RepID=A0A4U9TSS8_SERFO|nr:Glutamine--tRNA ligase [Serratia fonticola]